MDLASFQYDRSSGLYVAPVNEKKFEYTDGLQIEEYLLESIKKAKDISYESEELLHFIKDWPTYYHLGPGRANILKVLDLPQNSKVLELGCGCGAVTRYLGEKFNSVDALEGSSIRAEITRQRCRDLKNVKVFCSNIDQINFQPEYDIVTLIGVLEYAPVFFGKSPEDSCELLLKSARNALKKNGILIIAIENKIGLKYWTGFPEEHTGNYYEGIHGYPCEKTPVTFSKNELRNYLYETGLRNINFYYCFPDYKFTSTIFSDLGQEKELYFHNWIDVPFKNYGLPRKHTIHEALALRTLSKAGLLREMANSFLIVASETDSCNTIKTGWAAKKISGFPRKKQYQCITTLKVTPDLRIEKKKIYDEACSSTEISEDAFFIQKLYDSPWYSGDLLSFDIFESLFHSSFKESAKKVLTLFYDHLMEIFFAGKTDVEGYPLIRKDALDCILRNFVKNVDGLKYIDTELYSKEDVSIDFVLYRSIVNDIVSVQYPGIKTDLGDPEEFLLELISSFFPKYNKERLSRIKLIDRRFLTAILVENNPAYKFMNLGPEVSEKGQEFYNLPGNCSLLQMELNNIYASRSWRYTSLLRRIGSVVRHGAKFIHKIKN